MSEKIDSTVDEWVATWAPHVLSSYERTLIIGNLRGFYSWLRRRSDTVECPFCSEPDSRLRKQINSHLADMNEHELERLLEFLST